MECKIYLAQILVYCRTVQDESCTPITTVWRNDENNKNKPFPDWTRGL